MEVQVNVKLISQHQLPVNLNSETTLPVNEITQALAFRIKIELNDDYELKSNLHNFIRNYSSAVDKKQEKFKVKIIDRVKKKFLQDLAEFRREKRFPTEIVEDLEKILTQKKLKAL